MELESAARRSTEGGCAHTHTHTHTHQTHTPLPLPIIKAQRVVCFTCVPYGLPQIRAEENASILWGVLENTLIWRKKQETRMSPSAHVEEGVLEDLVPIPGGCFTKT